MQGLEPRQADLVPGHQFNRAEVPTALQCG